MKTEKKKEITITLEGREVLLLKDMIKNHTNEYCDSDEEFFQELLIDLEDM